MECGHIIDEQDDFYYGSEYDEFIYCQDCGDDLLTGYESVYQCYQNDVLPCERTRFFVRDFIHHKKS